MKLWLSHGELWPLMLQVEKRSRHSVEVEVPNELVREWRVVKKRFEVLNLRLHKFYAEGVKVTPKRLGV